MIWANDLLFLSGYCFRNWLLLQQAVGHGKKGWWRSIVAEAEWESAAAGIMCNRHHISCWASLCCPWNCSFPCSYILCWHFRGREDDNRALNPHWSSLAVDYASGTVGLGVGRRSHSCSESLSKLPTPPKNPLLGAHYLQSLCYHSNSLGIHHLHQPFLLPPHKGLP